MLICEVNNMRKFFGGAIMTSYRKVTYDIFFKLNFHNFFKKKLTLIRLLSITLPPLGLTFFYSMLALLAVLFFFLLYTSSYLMKIKPFGFLFFYGFSTQSPNIILKVSTLCSAKVVSEEDSKFANLFCKM
jgi:hypothetical protein